MSQVDDLLAANPFPGLRPFEAADAALFFGRDDHIDEIESRLLRLSFLAITGESGCGKSSLARAGLVARLQARGDAWRCAVLRPGDHPLAALAAALAPLLADGEPHARTEDLLFGRLSIGERGLIEAVAQARLPAGERVLVVVDQFEEIFRFDQSRDEAQAFVKLLLAVALAEASPVSVVLTMRSDMLGACAGHRGLAEAVSQGQFLVPRLTRTQRKQAIVGPVESRGQHIEARLVQRLLNDVSDAYDDLPVLQHVLARTWRHWARTTAGVRPIDLEDYEKVGTTKDAISLHGDEALADLPGLGPVVERVFRALTERVADVGARTRGTEGLERRRPQPLARLRAIVDAPAAEVDRVVERFRRAEMGFLASGAPLEQNPVIDLAHESLIRLWGRLRGWMDLEADQETEFRQLVQRARKHALADGQLLERGDLRDAQKRFGNRTPPPAWAAIVLGVELAAAQVELDRISSYLSRSRRRRVLKLALPSVLVLALAVLLVAKAIDLQEQRDQARRQELAAMASVERDRFPARAAVLASEVLAEDGGNRSALFTLRDSLAALETAHIERILDLGGVTAMSRSEDRSRLAMVTGRSVSVLDAKTLQPLGAALERAAQVDVALIPGDKRDLITRTADYRAQLQRLGDARVAEMKCPGSDPNVYTIAVSLRSDLVAFGCSDGHLLVGRWSDGGFERVFAARHRNTVWPWITALAFSPDDRFLASGDAEGHINLWRLDAAPAANDRAWIGQSTGAGGKRVESPLSHAKAVARLRFFASSNSLFVSASDDGTAMVWQPDVESRSFVPVDSGDKRNRWVLRHEHAVTEALFAPPLDGSYPVITLDGKAVQMWVNDERKRRQREHDSWVTQVDTSADGLQFATAGDDGTARLWSGATGAPLAVLRGHRDAVIGSFFLDGDGRGRRLLTLGQEGQVFVWATSTATLLRAIDRWVMQALPLPDGRWIVGDETGLHLLDGSKSTSVSAEALARLTVRRDGRYVGGTTFTSGVAKDNEFLLFDLRSAQAIDTQAMGEVVLGAFAGDTGELLTWDRKALQLWDSDRLGDAAAKPLASVPTGDLVPMGLAISPDGQRFALSVGNDVRLWSRREPAAPPLVLAGHTGTVTAMGFSADNLHLVTGGADRSVRVWALADTREARAVLVGHSAALSALAIAADGRHLLTGATDGSIGVWRFNEAAQRPEDRAERLATLRRHGEVVNSLAFGNDGRSIVSTSDDGTARVGPCEACFMTPAQLREAAVRLAVLPRQDRDELERSMAAPEGALQRTLKRLGLR
jgi:WD40 repeat protein